MQQNIPTPWAVAAIVVVLLVVGLIIWRGMSPRAPAAATAPGPGAADYKPCAGALRQSCEH